MIVSIGQFKISERGNLFSFLKMSKQIEAEARQYEGNISVQLSGGKTGTFLVLTLWKDVESMKRFSQNGIHKIALGKSEDMANEIQLLFYESSDAPTIEEAQQIIETHKETRVMKY